MLSLATKDHGVVQVIQWPGEKKVVAGVRWEEAWQAKSNCSLFLIKVALVGSVYIRQSSSRCYACGSICLSDVELNVWSYLRQDKAIFVVQWKKKLIEYLSIEIEALSLGEGR